MAETEYDEWLAWCKKWDIPHHVSAILGGPLGIKIETDNPVRISIHFDEHGAYVGLNTSFDWMSFALSQ